MESLFSRALEVAPVDCRLPSGRQVRVRRIRVRFGRASPDRLPEGALPSTYTSKPLVTFNGAAMFGELAVLRWLEVDGWEGVWLDTVHGRKAWRQMPTVAFPVRLPPAAQALYDRVVTANRGTASGAFDVMAWKGGHFVFLEYKGPDDQPSRRQPAWIEAALSVGVSENDLFVVSAVSG
jgi:hypothetical protein